MLRERHFITTSKCFAGPRDEMIYGRFIRKKESVVFVLNSEVFLTDFFKNEECPNVYEEK